MIAVATAHRQPVECIVRVDGEEIDAHLYPFLREVQVAMSRGAAATATLSFDSVRGADGRWSVQDAGIFAAWKEIRIEAAFGAQSEEVMRGYIKDVRCEYPEDMSAARVTVNAQDESLALDREHVRRALSTEEAPKNDGTLVGDIAREHGLDADADNGLTNAALNIDATYVRFLRDRAEANGFEFYVRGGTLHFHAPRLGQQPAPGRIRLYAGPLTNCLRFSAQYDGHRPDEVAASRAAETGTEAEEVRFNPNQEVLGANAASSASSGLPAFVWQMQSPSGATADEVSSRAQAKANENAWKVSAEGELDGALYGHVLLTHTLVVVDGAGETYGGTYYVDEVQHRFSQEGYREVFKLLRNATGEQGAAPGAGVLAAVLG